MNIVHITHYGESDKKFMYDYYSVTLKDGLGEVIAHYGDSYHDRGLEKAEGFIAGVEWATGKKVTLKREKIADGQP